MTNKIERFEDLEVWKTAMECAKLVYDATSNGKFSQDYVLRDKIRRAAVSFFSNIAEGFERDGNKELGNFLTIAKGSCGEARAQAIFANKLGYLSSQEFDELSAILVKTSRQLSGFRTYLRRSDFKGRKIL